MPETEAGARSIGELLDEACAGLVAAGCDTPRLDAEVLLAAALGCDRGSLYMRLRDDAGEPAASRFSELLERRRAREPVAYITGTREFRRISLIVDRRVLIPRPETELLVEVGLELPAGARVADVGTGSGAVALALKDERDDLTVVGLDLSARALEVARANAAQLGLSVEFSQANLLGGGSYDAVLANLPYVADDDVLAPEITQYEPRAALFAGADGLAVIRRLVARLRGVPLVGLEVGLGQAEAVESLLRGAGFGTVQRRRDLAGHERVVVGRTGRQ